MHKLIGSIGALMAICLLFVNPAMAETSTSSSSTTTSTSNGAPNNPSNTNSNANTTTTVTNSTTTTTVDNGDARIVGQIYKKFSGDSALNGTALTVNCTNGIVTISGTVTATAQAEEAIKLAKSIAGVKEVNSSIDVSTNQTEFHQPKSANY